MRLCPKCGQPILEGSLTRTENPADPESATYHEHCAPDLSPAKGATHDEAGQEILRRDQEG